MLPALGEQLMLRFSRILWALELLGGVVALYFGGRATNTPARAALLMFGTGLAVYSLLQLVARPLLLSPSALRRIVGPTAYTVASLDYLGHGTSKVWLVLAWMGLVLGVVGTIGGVLKLTLDQSMLRLIRRTYRSKEPLRLATPLVFVLAEPGIGPHFAYRIAAQLTDMLYKLRRKRLLYLLVSDTVSTYEQAFQEWLAEVAAALMIVQLVPELSAPDFRRTAEDFARRSHGKVFVVQLRVSPGAILQDLKYRELDAGVMEIALHPASLRKDNEILSALTDQMAMITEPIAASDTKLENDQRQTAYELAKSGLPPIADSYFKFRLSKSDVERLLCLLDCVEVIVKCSVIVLLVARWMQNREPERDVASKLARPTLGHWVTLLRQLIDKPNSAPLYSLLAKFWSGRTHDALTVLISHVSTSSCLAWSGPLPTSNVGWLNWFVWFRNTTRGHGVLDDKLAGPIWHDFHEVLLLMVAGLHDLVAGTSLLRAGAEIDGELLQGWLRHRVQHGPQSEKAGLVPLNLVDRASGTLFPVFPFIVQRGHSILLWNSIKGTGLEFVDYGSGKVHHLSLGETDLAELWLGSNLGL